MKSKQKIGIIIQARLGSTRLPKKILKDLSGKSVLEHVVDRMKRVEDISEVVVATTTESRDDELCEFLSQKQIKYYRGSENHVLSRFYETAKEFDFDVVVRITSDCPLIDPKVTKQIIDYYLSESYDMVTNGGADISNRTFPRGFDTSVFSFGVLEEAFLKATTNREFEHVTPYIYDNKHVGYFKNEQDYSKYRLTLDTPEDFKLINCIYENLYNDNNFFGLEEIVNFLTENPHLRLINSNIKQKEV